MKLTFTVKGDPQGKQRHRTGRGHSYTPPKTVAYQKKVRAEFLAQCGVLCKIHTGPVRFECIAYMPRPKAHFGTGRNSGKLKDSAPYYPLIKPDFDNIEKVIADSLNGIVYLDDKQIVDNHCLKLYELAGSITCVHVTIELFEQQTMKQHRERNQL